MDVEGARLGLGPNPSETRILFAFWSKKISPQRRRARGEEKGSLYLRLGSEQSGSSSAPSASPRFKGFQVYLAWIPIGPVALTAFDQ